MNPPIIFFSTCSWPSSSLLNNKTSQMAAVFRSNLARRKYAVAKCPEISAKNFVVFLFNNISRIFLHPSINFFPRKNLTDIWNILAIPCIFMFIHIIYIPFLVIWECEHKVSTGFQQFEHPANSILMIRDVLKNTDTSY